MQIPASTIGLSILTTLLGAIGLASAGRATELPDPQLAEVGLANRPETVLALAQEGASLPAGLLCNQGGCAVDRASDQNEFTAPGADFTVAGVTEAKVSPGGGAETPVQPPVTQVAQATDLKPSENAAVRIEISPTQDSRIPADGRSFITLAGQILNAQGQPVAEDVVVTLTTSAGKFQGADQEPDRPGFQAIAREGRFSVQLQSSLEPQKVRVRAAIDGKRREQQLYTVTAPPTPPGATPGTRLTASPVAETPLEAYTQVEFTTNLRPALVSGVVNFRIGRAGTDFYSSFREFLNPDILREDDVQFDFSTAVFAIAPVGEWLITAAYNNQRPLNETCNGDTRLFRDAQFCDQVYPVYGDSSTVDYLTPSIDSVYFKIERNSPIQGAGQDYLLWGDYTTREFATSSQYFTATTRQLHGLKVNYNLGNLRATFMYGNNLQGFQRDAIAPNGTSGYYFLSRRLVVGGSESVFLETEELGRPGSVVERKTLLRGPDYEIDYDRGTLLFRRPILTTEFDLFGRTLVRRIVVTYQYEGNGTGDTSLYAGRLQYNFSQQFQRESWAGLSYLREEQGGRDFELYGVDALIPLGKEAQIVAEIARSTNNSVFGGVIGGSAYRFEVNGPLLRGVLGRAYYRSVDEGFANNATFSFTAGQTRYGAQVAAQVAPTTQVQVQLDREINYGTAAAVRLTPTDLFNPGVEAAPGASVNNSLTTISAGVQQRLGAATLGVDWVSRLREDRTDPSRLSRDSNQLVSRFSMPLAKTLTFRAQNELSLGGADPIYPTRTTVGLDWAMMPGITMRLAQQFLSGGQYKSYSITSLDTLVDYKLTEDTAVTGRYSVLGGFNSGVTGQGAIGLNHRIVLGPGLRANLTYERVFGNVFAYTAAGQQFLQPYAVGQSAASLGIQGGNSFGVGLEYTDNPDFKASARFDYRTSDAGNNLVISVGAAGKLSPSLTLLGRFQQAGASNQLLENLTDTLNLKLGVAYRDPNSDKFNALMRYEFRQNPGLTPDSLLVGVGTGSTAHLFAVEAIYAPDFRWEFYGKFALRASQSTLARDLVGTNTITLGQFRVGYRLGYNVDLVGETRFIGQSVTGFDEVGFAVEAGYYLTPDLRVGVGYSFGEANDRDLNNRSRGGPYLTFTMKLNQLFGGFGVQPTAPPQQRESQVKPVANQPTPGPQATTPFSSLTGQVPSAANAAIGGAP